MARGGRGTRQPHPGRPQRPELSVSRLEQHHVDALGTLGGHWQDAARALLAQRATGDGFGLVAVSDAEPVGLLGVRLGEAGWQLHGLEVAPGLDADTVCERLAAAAEELARPLGRLGVVPGARQAWWQERGYEPSADGLAKTLT